MNYRVGKAKDGRVLILESSGFVASRIDGKWTNKILFSSDEQNEDFTKVRDVNEAKALYEEACKALGRSLSVPA